MRRILLVLLTGFAAISLNAQHSFRSSIGLAVTQPGQVLVTDANTFVVHPMHFSKPNTLIVQHAMGGVTFRAGAGFCNFLAESGNGVSDGLGGWGRFKANWYKLGVTQAVGAHKVRIYVAADIYFIRQSLNGEFSGGFSGNAYSTGFRITQAGFSAATGISYSPLPRFTIQLEAAGFLGRRYLTFNGTNEQYNVTELQAIPFGMLGCRYNFLAEK